MAFLRALLYSVGVFVLLAIISLIIVGIMRLLYRIVHKEEKKVVLEKTIETKSTAPVGKEG
jgi:hypothetical protein